MSTQAANPASLAKQPATAVIGYGLGDFANNLAFSMSTSFLLLYYTDVAGLAPAAIATMFLVVRLWDAIADLFAGRMVDRAQTQWGKFRPFIFWVAIPVLFLSFVCFNVPTKGVKWLGLFTWDVTDGGIKLLYAYLTYAIFGLVYSLINIPYGSLASAMTQSVNERAKLVSARAFGSAFGGLFLTYVVAPQVNDVKGLAPLQAGTIAGTQVTADQAAATWQKLGATSYEQAALAYQQKLQDVFTITTLAFIVLGTIMYWLTFLWCRETVVRASGKPTTVKETLETIKTNSALQILCAASFFYLTGMFAVGGSTAYYAQYVLGSMAHMPTIALVNSGIGLLITPFIPAIIAKLGKKTVFQFCGLFSVVGGVGLWFVPTVHRGDPPSVGAMSLALALILLAIKGLGASLINTVMFGLGADTVEYGEWKTGKRTEGATYSIFSFTRKITQSVGGALGGFLLSFGGYLSGAALAEAGGVQPESAIDAIKFTIGPLPAICAILAMLAFIKYPLTDKLFDQIRDENEARKLAKAQAEIAAGE